MPVGVDCTEDIKVWIDKVNWTESYGRYEEKVDHGG